jgi:hypothetical protein
MFQRNLDLFNELRKFNLPVGEYIVCASGPLGIRGLREMKDLDLKVSDKLWKELSQKYEPFYDDCQVIKLRLSENIEAMCQESFANREQNGPKIEEQLRDAEIIDGLPFENIKTTLYYKRNSNREKDKKDVELIESWLRNNS